MTTKNKTSKDDFNATSHKTDVISPCLSYLTMRKVRLFTPTMSGNIYVYKDCYGVKWLAYSDFPRKRCLYNGL